MPVELSVQVIVFIIVFLLTLFTGPIVIPLLKRLKVGQTIRDDGPVTHLKKQNIPTIGGVIFLIPLLVVTIYYSDKYPGIIPLTLVTLGYGTIGFLDDWIKVVKKRKDGLYAWQKSLGLILVSIVFISYVMFYTDLGTETFIPFTGVEITLNPVIYMLFLLIVLNATTNSVNLTDGVDGLAAGVTLIVMVFFTIVAMTRNEWEYIKIFTSIMAGGCLGFLVFNMYPAKVIMGDTGSLALGASVAVAAIMMKIPLIIIIAGGVYVAVSLSVILQVVSFKLRGKRIFKMAPIHHHFELLGWKETKVAAVFWSATAFLCLISILALNFRVF